jgi:hypothetical protein
MLIVVIVREFSSSTEWFVQSDEQHELIRQLPTPEEITSAATQLPPTAKRFDLQEPVMGMYGSTGEYRKYIGFYNPSCQEPLDEKEKARVAQRKKCIDRNATANSLLTGRVEPELACGGIFEFPPKRPAEECVLWEYGDHYLQNETVSYWFLNRLYGSEWFLIPAILWIASFANLYLVRPVWIPLARWVKG